MASIDSLQNLLTRLPGIGPRQARRFAFFLMQVNQDYINELSDTLTELRSAKHHCGECNRIYFLTHAHLETNRCSTCADETRDGSKVLLLAKQADFENIDRSGEWNGRYFILGQLVRLADKTPENRLPIQSLLHTLSGFEVEELVMGLPINPEGEFTQEIIIEQLKGFLSESKITVSQLARGLSSGSELEYTDPDTISQALKNRR